MPDSKGLELIDYLLAADRNSSIPKRILGHNIAPYTNSEQDKAGTWGHLSQSQAVVTFAIEPRVYVLCGQSSKLRLSTRASMSPKTLFSLSCMRPFVQWCPEHTGAVIICEEGTVDLIEWQQRSACGIR